MTFGNRLRDARKASKMTQRQLADAVGAKHNSVSDWENNKNKPDPDTIELICGVLEITPNYLLATSTEEFSPAEKLIIKQYRELDTHGREMVDFVLDREHERSTAPKDNVVKMPTYLQADAASVRTDIDIQKGTDTSENDIMDSEDF